MRSGRGFTLIEVMIALLFITIGFFGYVALHSRILHSGQRLEEKEVVRAGTDFFEGIEVGRITLGSESSIDGTPYLVHPNVERLRMVSTSVEGRDTSWTMDYPEVYRPGLEQTLETGSTVMIKPYSYGWEKR